MQETFYHLPCFAISKPVHLAVTADIHDKPVQKCIDSLEKHNPDFILIPGDIIHGETPKDDSVKMNTCKNILQVLQRFTKIAPTYLSLGNHEWLLSKQDLDILHETGVNLLDNQFILCNSIVIGGLTSGRVSGYRRRNPDYLHMYHSINKADTEMFSNQISHKSSSIDPNCMPETDWLQEFMKTPGYHILLSHHPEYWYLSPVRLCEYGIDLILSGHAHGGQIRYPSPSTRQMEGLFAPNQGLFPKYTAGKFQNGHSTMIISRGLSNTTFIPRLLNPTELIYVDLLPNV